MNNLSKIIDSLELKFFKITQENKNLKKKNENLLELVHQAEQKSKEATQQIDNLTKQIGELKMVNSLLGSEDDKRETKFKINTLIREIDYCITQLSK